MALKIGESASCTDAYEDGHASLIAIVAFGTMGLFPDCRASQSTLLTLKFRVDAKRSRRELSCLELKWPRGELGIFAGGFRAFYDVEGSL